MYGLYSPSITRERGIWSSLTDKNFINSYDTRYRRDLVLLHEIYHNHLMQNVHFLKKNLFIFTAQSQFVFRRLLFIPRGHHPSPSSSDGLPLPFRGPRKGGLCVPNGPCDRDSDQTVPCYSERCGQGARSEYSSRVSDRNFRLYNGHGNLEKSSNFKICY